MQITKVADSLIDGVDYAVRTLADLAFGANPRELCDIETVDSDKALICKQGTYLTVVEVEGCGSVVGQQEYDERVKELNQALVSRFREGSGHKIKIIFESDPDNVINDLRDNYAATRAQSRRYGIEVDDLIDEKIENNAKYCHRERVYLCLYTTQKTLTADDIGTNRTRTNTARRNIGAGLGRSQNVLNYFETLRSIHNEAVSSMARALGHAGLEHRIVYTDDVLKNIVHALKGHKYAKTWRPDTLSWGANKEEREIRTSGVPQKKIKHEKDIRRYLGSVNGDNNESLEPVLPRAIRDQVIPDNIFTPGGRFVVSGERIYAPVQVTKYCDAPADFDRLIDNLRGTPFRISFTLTPDGLAGDFVRATIASAFSWVSANNRQINTARNQLKEYMTGEYSEVVGLSITATTWAPLEEVIDPESQELVYRTSLIESRANELQTAFNDWGSSQAASTMADPVEVVFSTIPGLVGGHVSPRIPAPLKDVVAMLPISRPLTAWKQGSMLFRTRDGRPLPYEQYSKQQSAWITLLVGPMGYSKTSTMNALNLAFLTQPSDSDDLPYLRGIDFGYGSKGVVDIMKSALPKTEQYKAQYIKLQNSAKYSYNCFDTPLGNRTPLPNQATFLRNFITTICHSLSDYKSLDGLVGLTIREAYKRYTDDNHNPGAKRWSPGIDLHVDELISKHGIRAEDRKTPWWSIVDALFECAERHGAGVAQRYAMPTLEDLSAIATSANVLAEYPDEFNGKQITKLLSRSLREAIDRYPFLKGATRFDISQSPIVCLDLMDIVQSGSDLSEEERRNAGIIFLAAMRILTADFFMDESYADYFEPRYREYHRSRIQRLRTLKKRIFVDERHKVKGITSAEAQFNQLIAEGRKFFIDVVQGSQIFSDFNKKIQDLATTIILCGSGSPKASQEIAEHYALNETHKAILDAIKPPTAAGAEALTIFKTRTIGRQVLHTLNTEGPLMLCAIATEASDRHVRGQLYARARTIKEARAAFAKAFPGGSVKPELDRRLELMGDGLYTSRTGHVLEDIVEEVCEKYLD